MTNPDTAQAPVNTSRVVDPSDPRWKRLHALIEEHSLQRGNFILSSGRTSKYIFQLRQTVMLPEGAKILGDVIVDYVSAKGVSCVGGLAVGAVPLVSAVATMSFVKGAPVHAFFVRKEAKAHGALERIDGHVAENAEVLMVDDVATSGGSILKAIDGMHTEHPSCFARKALVIVDRQEGAAETLAARGIELVSIFRRSDFKIDG